MAKKTENDLLQEMYSFIKEIKELVNQNGTFESFNQDWKSKHAMSMLFIAVGELCNKLIGNCEDKYASYPDMISAINLRNFLAHGYWDIDYLVLWNTAVEDIDILEKIVIDNMK